MFSTVLKTRLVLLVDSINTHLMTWRDTSVPVLCMRTAMAMVLESDINMNLFHFHSVTLTDHQSYQCLYFLSIEWALNIYPTCYWSTEVAHDQAWAISPCRRQTLVCWASLTSDHLEVKLAHPAGGILLDSVYLMHTFYLSSMSAPRVYKSQPVT